MKQNQYEITYLVDPKLSEEDRGSVGTNIDELITKFSGIVKGATPTLRKKLAYEIKHNNSAFLRVMNIEIEASKIADIQDFLKRNSNVLRFTILATKERTRMSQELLDKYTKRGSKDSSGKPEQQKAVQKTAPAKEATMQDVEKGIEEALNEEVK